MFFIFRLLFFICVIFFFLAAGLVLVALLGLRSGINRHFRRPPDEPSSRRYGDTGNVIEGEYKVIDESTKDYDASRSVDVGNNPSK